MYNSILIHKFERDFASLFVLQSHYNGGTDQHNFFTDIFVSGEINHTGLSLINALVDPGVKS